MFFFIGYFISYRSFIYIFISVFISLLFMSKKTGSYSETKTTETYNLFCWFIIIHGFYKSLIVRQFYSLPLFITLYVLSFTCNISFHIHFSLTHSSQSFFNHKKKSIILLGPTTNAYFPVKKNWPLPSKTQAVTLSSLSLGGSGSGGRTTLDRPTVGDTFGERQRTNEQTGRTKVGESTYRDKRGYGRVFISVF